jgi:hypothetical protein
MHARSELVWWSAAGNKGWALPYPSIMCHATCRDTTSEGAFPHPCIYCHLDAGDYDEFGPNGDDVCSVRNACYCDLRAGWTRR